MILTILIILSWLLLLGAVILGAKGRKRLEEENRDLKCANSRLSKLLDEGKGE